jgi:hypothetical protein
MCPTGSLCANGSRNRNIVGCLANVSIWSRWSGERLPPLDTSTTSPSLSCRGAQGREGRGRPESCIFPSWSATNRSEEALGSSLSQVVNLRSISLAQGTFTHKDPREHLAPLLGKEPSQLTPGRITYDLRRLRLHGLIERISKTHSYRITAKGSRTAIFYTRLYNRLLRTGLATISPDASNTQLPMAKSIRVADSALNR